jgi:hypothetical protein
MIQSPKPKGETCVAGAIETPDPEINVIALWLPMSNEARRSGGRTEHSGKRNRNSCFFDIADGRA